jgi:hypothetical protein
MQRIPIVDYLAWSLLMVLAWCTVVRYINDMGTAYRGPDTQEQQTMTHIEVTDSKGSSRVSAGQLLAVIRETPCFYWVRAFDGTPLQVSKKTKRINGGEGFFLRAHRQPLMNL